MKLLFLSFLIFFSTLSYADDDYSVRFFVGAASASDLDELYTFQGLNRSPYETNVVGFDLGYRLYEDIFTLPFDLYIKGGVSYFDENGYQADFLELVTFFKLIYKLDIFDNQIRLGFGEGWSYAGRVPYREAQEAIRENDNQSKFLNYLDISFDFDVGKLFRVKSLEHLYFGYLIKHRSGFHGVYNGVADGGSNYNSLYLEKNF